MVAQLQLQTRNSTWSFCLTVHCLPRLGLNTPAARLSSDVMELWSDLPNLADPTFGIPNKVDILLGADVYPHLILPGLLYRGGLVGQLTVAGWTLAGRERCHAASPPAVACFVTQDAESPPWHEQLNALMQRFWELEDVPRIVRQSPDDVECETIFAEHRRAADGRYVVRLPLKRNGFELLGESLTSAMASLRSLHRRLRSNPEMAGEYMRFMNEYLGCGHMRLMTDDERHASARPTHYIPHHGIWQAGDQRKKLRVVFNASRPTSTGYSLNDILHQGPKLQTCLPSVLLRWRRHRIAFCGDIQMMFRQIWVDKRDVDLQRILWSPDESSPPKHYQLLTVTYGEASAPYLSLRTILQLCEDEGHAWPEAVPIVKRDRYVDDILSGADNVETARLRRDQLIGLLRAGGFPLRKWVANEPELLQDLSEDSRLRPTWRQFSADGPVSELGVSWDPVGDRFHLTTPTIQQQQQQTKRSTLATLARLFDPCGWIAPVLLNAKLIIQDLWRARLEWDQPIPTPLDQRWQTFLSQLQNVSQLTIPRWIGYRPSAAMQLHAFADASRRAMAAVVYSRVENSEGDVHVHILVSRTKLTPIKSLQPDASRPARMTIPRLELRAALLAARLLHMVADEYGVGAECCHSWSDSQIVLHWLHSLEPTNNSLIDNYVAHIQELLPSHVWKYVSTDSNPADVASRGTDLSTLQEMRTWWEGPSWLSGPQESWPGEIANSDECNGLLAVVQTCCATQHHITGILDKFSDLNLLLRFLARLRRWIRRRRQHDSTPEVLAPLTNVELRDVYLAAVRLSQQQFFSLEIDSLQRGKRVAAGNSLLSLDPFIVDGVLRVGGRLQHSTLSFDEQHPPILDRRCPLAQLVIRWAHVRALHGGVRLTSAYAARKAWIVGGRRQIKATLRGCVVCARLQARPATQQMAPLPTARITQARAFSRTGVDYTGPFNILSSKGRGIRSRKGYVAVFICMTTKAAHLELVGDLSTESFLGALTRFCARRGRPSEIWSDNATCFRAADRELREALQSAELRWELIAGTLADQGIAWHFIPPRAPHFGGLWEAGVKAMKRHLRRTIGPRNLTYEEFSTLLASIEAVLNSRPLTPLTGELDDLDVLTPGHFLIGGPLNSVVNATDAPENIDRLTHWKLVSGIRDQFWGRWSREYLNTLQQRPKWKVARRNFQVNDVVVLMDATLLSSSGSWPLGRIVAVHPGSDGLVRAATVRTATSEYVRPVSQLSLLPIQPHEARETASDGLR